MYDCRLLLSSSVDLATLRPWPESGGKRNRKRERNSFKKVLTKSNGVLIVLNFNNTIFIQTYEYMASDVGSDKVAKQNSEIIKSLLNSC